ncbi:MAG: cytochrome b/b6 domain-containing protein [Nocardioidaceae bacterium]
MTPLGHEPAGSLPRFSRAERAVHWSIAVLLLVCIVTAAILYNGSLAIRVGHRRLVELVHVYAGFALPVPVLIGLVSAAYRSDLRRLNRFTPSDWRWLSSRQRRDGSIPVGKFNAGQKLNASLSTGAVLVLLGTGILMYFPDLTRLSWRTGATFVHDWFALGVGLLVIGHIGYAMNDPESRRGMLSGRVSSGWARKQHGEWVDEVAGAAGPGGADEVQGADEVRDSPEDTAQTASGP